MDLQRRHIQLKGSSNLRDIGGYPAAGGKRVKWGAVYRSGALWGLTTDDWRWIEEKGIAGLCDLRSDAEREIAPTIWQGSSVPQILDQTYDGAALFARSARDPSAGIGAIEGGLYLLFARLLAPSFRGLFHALHDGKKPVIVHCTAGQDRTGLAVALLLGALGVDRETIHADYLLSTELRRPEHEIDRESLSEMSDRNVVAQFYSDLIARHGPSVFTPKRLVDESGRPLVDIALEAIDREWGSVACYLDTELGVGAPQIARLQEMMLEPAD